MFPVYMKRKGTPPPETVPHYIVAKNGIFLKKENWWMEATIPVKQIAVLEEQNVGMTLKVEPINAILLMRAWRFFQAVYDKFRTESAVLLHYSEKLGWELTIPTQSATFSHVSYAMTDRLPGYSFIGTMHSHSSMSAFHSGTDVGDEAQVDGIHITFGDLDEKERFSMDPEIVVNGTRFTLPLYYLSGVKQVSKGSESFVSRYLFVNSHPRYTIECPELKDWKVPDEWITRVGSKQVFTQPVAVTYTPVLADENPPGGNGNGESQSSREPV